MPIINPTLPNDGETIDASDVNIPLNAILGVLNGAIDSNNIATGSLPWSVMSASISNAIPATAMQDGANIIKHRAEAEFAYFANGCIWTGLGYGSLLTASMSAGILYINGYRMVMSAIATRTFAANSDTYVDAIDNGNGTASIVYTAVGNNIVSPALAANSVRLAIIVTGATSIAAATSINQGQFAAVLPIVSTIPYSVCDGLGNLINPRDPQRKVLGYRQYVVSTGPQATSTSDINIVPLTVPVIVPNGRNIEAKMFIPDYDQTGGIGTIYAGIKIKEGATVLTSAGVTPGGVNLAQHGFASVPLNPTAGLHTYQGALANNATGPNFNLGASAGSPGYLIIELK